MKAVSQEFACGCAVAWERGGRRASAVTAYHMAGACPIRVLPYGDWSTRAGYFLAAHGWQLRNGALRRWGPREVWG